MNAKRITAVVTAVLTGTALYATTATADAAPAKPKTVTVNMHNRTAKLPLCKHEDGSTQQVCVWVGKRQGNRKGDTIVNLDWGNYSYNLSDNGMTDYTQEG